MGRAQFQAVSAAGLVIDRVTPDADQLLVVARSGAPDAACTACGARSAQIHSRYQRRLLDLRSHGRTVHLLSQVRRFRCGNAGCGRKIFGEVLDTDIAPKMARRTSRLEAIVHHIGIALGGRPAASLARRLMLPVSRDTLLRVVRRRAMPSGTAPVRIVGIDDFAWKRGQRYGTIVCDLERRRAVDLLPDREAATVAAWLAAHPGIIVVSRDRGGRYGQAATQGAPQAVQLADRWRLMENASAAFLEAVRRSMPSIRHALGLRAGGFEGGLRVVTEWATRRRRSEKAGLGRPGPSPPARKLSPLMTTRREQLTKAEAATVSARDAGDGVRRP